jgi:cytochrome c oxidase assembly factor CtaG
MLSTLLANLPIFAVAAAATGYYAAHQRIRRATGTGVPVRQRVAFDAGLAVVIVALVGPLDAAASRSFSSHMVQHVLLTMVAAPLLVLGGALGVALRAWPGRPRRALRAIVHHPVVRIITNPIVAWGLFFVVLWGTHVTELYDAALRSEGLHILEHAAYLTTAVLFWMPVLGRDPMPARLSYPARILYLFLAMPAMAFLGLTIAATRHVLYPTYAVIEGLPRALADQQAAGAIMWVTSMVMVLPALVLVLFAWMRADEREAARIDARLLDAGAAR